MAILTDAQLHKITKDWSRDPSVISANVNVLKGQANAGTQAIEDYIENTARAAINSDIDAAISPGTLTNVEKKKLRKYYLRVKFGLE